MESSATLQLLTPAYLVPRHGDPDGICPACLRQALRLWHRLLGGSMSDEVLFEPETLGLELTDRRMEWEDAPEHPEGRATMAYRTYFQSVSGDFRGQLAAGGRVALPGSTFTFHLHPDASVDRAAREHMARCLRAFSLLGTVGLRGARGLGAVTPELPATFADVKEWRERVPALHLAWLEQGETGEPLWLPDADGALLALGRYLRRRMTEPDGSLSFDRLRLRPVAVREGVLAVHYRIDPGRSLGLDGLLTPS